MTDAEKIYHKNRLVSVRVQDWAGRIVGFDDEHLIIALTKGEGGWNGRSLSITTCDNRRNAMGYRFVHPSNIEILKFKFGRYVKTK